MIRASRPSFVIAVVAAILIALVLHGWRAGVHPLWLDEAYSLYAAEHDWTFLWRTVPRYETHPPFYYSLLRLWTLAIGDGVGAVRALGVIATSVAAGVAMVAARDAARLAGLEARAWWLVIATGALAIVAPALHNMAHEVRPYPVMILAYAVAVAAVLRVALRAEAGERLAGPALAMVFVAQAIVLWLHNLGVFYAATLSLALALLVVRRSLSRGDWAALVIGHVAMALVYVPALLIALDQAPTWMKATWLRFTWGSLWGRVAQVYAAPGRPLAISMALAAVLALTALFASRRRARLALALALLAWLPLILSVAVSALVAPVFIPRIMTALAVPMMMILAFAAVAPGPLRWAGCAILLVLAGQFFAQDIRKSKAGPRQDWYGTVDWLAPRLRPGDEIWAYPNEGALPLGFALRDRGIAAVVRPIPVPVPAIDVGGWYPTGSRGVVSLPPARLRAIVATGRRVPTVWLIRLGANAYDKGDVLLHELERERRQIGRWRSAPIDLIGLRGR